MAGGGSEGNAAVTIEICNDASENTRLFLIKKGLNGHGVV